jgi:hypothetical protein
MLENTIGVALANQIQTEIMVGMAPAGAMVVTVAMEAETVGVVEDTEVVTGHITIDQKIFCDILQLLATGFGTVKLYFIFRVT